VTLAAMLAPVGLLLLVGGAWLTLNHLRMAVVALLLVRPVLDLVGAGPLSGAVALSLIALWATMNTEKWEGARNPWLVGPFVVVAYSAVTVLFAPARSDAVNGVLRLSGSLVMIWFIRHAFGNTPRDRLLVLVTASASALIPVVLGVRDFLLGGGYLEGDVRRIPSSFENANVFGFYLLAILPIIVATAVLAKTPLVRRFILLVPVLLLLLYMTYTRTALVGVFVAFTIVTLSKKKNRKLKIGALALAIMLSSFLPSVRSRFTDLNDPNPYGRAGNSNSFAWRVEHWKLISTYIPAQPATGVGLSGTRAAIKSEFLAHSAWLQLVFELGAVGVVALGSMAVQLRRLHRRAKVRVADYEIDVLGRASMFSCAAFLVIGLADNVLVATALHWYYFIPTALLSGALANEGTLPRTHLRGKILSSRRQHRDATLPVSSVMPGSPAVAMSSISAIGSVAS
jgi:O-Antigen ligase